MQYYEIMKARELAGSPCVQVLSPESLESITPDGCYGPKLPHSRLPAWQCRWWAVWYSIYSMVPLCLTVQVEQQWLREGFLSVPLCHVQKKTSGGGLLSRWISFFPKCLKYINFIISKYISNKSTCLGVLSPCTQHCAFKLYNCCLMKIHKQPRRLKYPYSFWPGCLPFPSTDCQNLKVDVRDALYTSLCWWEYSPTRQERLI